MHWRLSLVAIGVVAYLATGFAVVRPGEVGVVRRFGRILGTPGPGLWIGLPWGIERVDRIAVDRIRRVPVGDEAEPLLTGDQNLVQIRAVIEYTVHSHRVSQYLAERDRIDDAIVRVADAALGEWANARGIDNALLNGKATLPNWLASCVRARLEPLGLGIEVLGASVSELTPPDEVRNAFDAVTRAQSSIRTCEQDAEREAERVRAAAQSVKFATEQRATSDAHAALTAARADADAFRHRWQQYRLLKATNPNVLAALWWAELGPMFARMHAAGRVQLLDTAIGPDGLDVMQKVPPPGK